MGRCAARDALVSAPVSDANLVVGAFASVSVGGRPLRHSRCWRLVTGQDVEPVDGSDVTNRRWRVAGSVDAHGADPLACWPLVIDPRYTVDIDNLADWEKYEALASSGLEMVTPTNLKSIV